VADRQVRHRRRTRADAGRCQCLQQFAVEQRFAVDIGVRVVGRVIAGSGDNKLPA
jgi:hypothetical protein